MALADALRARRTELANRWEELVLATYPAQAAGFFGDEKDPFRNPVGATIRRALGELTDGLLEGTDGQELFVSVHAIVRMRAVQDFSPASAVGFVLLFRRAVAEVLTSELAAAPAGELLELDERLDRLLLLAWESYAVCRQKIYEIRAREATARTYALLKRAGLLAEAAEAAKEAEKDPRRSLAGSS